MDHQRFTRRAFAGLLICFGCAQTIHAAQLDCEPEPQVPVEQIKANVILVGETHGTEQVPALMGRLLCSLLRADRPVVLGLERAATEQTSLDRFMTSPGEPDDVRALLDQGEWKSPTQDGRSSAAMLGLLDRLRQWRQAGVTVPVIALRPTLRFQTSPSDPKQFQIRSDRDMADSVTEALKAHPKHTVVVLAGSFHTAVASHLHQDVIGGPSTGDVLASRGQVYVIRLVSKVGGQTWSWRAGEPQPHPNELPSGPLDLQDGRTDGTVDIGPLTASPPARPR